MATPPFLPNEAVPGASDLLSAYPAAEQAFRDIIESWILIEHNTNGTHKQTTLDDIATPTIATGLVGLWQESGVLKTRFAAGAVFDVLTTNGGTLTGDLTLSGAPTSDLHASTKKYVDDVTSGISRETAISTSSGTAHGFTGIAAGVSRITFMLSDVSLSGNDELLLQIGDAGDYETDGYVSRAGQRSNEATSTIGFVISAAGNNTNNYSGKITLCRLDGNTWVSSGTLDEDDTDGVDRSAGTKTLTAELDRIQIRPTGSNTFASGVINIIVE